MTSAKAVRYSYHQEIPQKKQSNLKKWLYDLFFFSSFQLLFCPIFEGFPGICTAGDTDFEGL